MVNGVTLDNSGLEILTRQQCLALLGGKPVGRIVFTDQALPAVQPVNFVVDGDDVIIRAAAGSKLDAAVRGAVVAFETDEYDVATHTGWSVTITGQAQLVSDSEELAHLRDLPLRPWAPGPHDHFIRIPITIVNGRRLPTGDSPPAESHG